MIRFVKSFGSFAASVAPAALSRPSFADVADNYLVFAWTDLEKKKARDVSGLSAFIIERKFKGIMLGRGPVSTMVVRGDTYGLFDIEGQLIVPEKRKKKKRQLRRSRRRVR